MSDEEIGIVKESNNCIYGKGKKNVGWELGVGVGWFLSSYV